MKAPCADAAFDIIAMTIARIDLRIDIPVILVATAEDHRRVIVLRDGRLVPPHSSGLRLPSLREFF